MAKKPKRHPRKKTLKLKNALDSARLARSLRSLPPAELAEFLHDLRVYMHYWIGDPTEDRISDLRQSFPLLDPFIDFGVVLNRMASLELFDRSPLGVPLKQFLPELTIVRDSALDLIRQLPQGIEKAECWLRPIAKHASADADVEAAVYFASKGIRNLVDVSDLRNSWHAAVCYDIESGSPVGKVPHSVRERARSKTISLAEAASVLSFNNSLPRFFSFRDEEEDFIDAAMFRAVEWFAVAGFEPWLRSLIADLSAGPQYGIEHPQASWWLFHWCRSDLALRMADRNGLEAWLWALMNGPLERDKPWVVFNPERENPSSSGYVPTAAIIPFVWHRIRPSNMKDDVVNRASEFLFQTQMACGAWPTSTADSKPCLMSTSLAVHGLVAHKPRGWQDAVARASKWIAGEQDESGHWYVQGGPVVMITILALDSLELAAGGTNLTFTMRETGSDGAKRRLAVSEPGDESPSPVEPTYDYSLADWHHPEAPPITSVSLSRGHEVTQPQVALVVATETELLQTLRVMTPPPRRRRLWKVIHDYDTYYLGRFGVFHAVVTSSGMGSQGVTGSTLSVNALIHEWNPKVVILLGIGFGASRKKYLPGDVLIADHVIPYEYQRIGSETIFRNPVPPSSAVLLNRFRDAIDWRFLRPDGSPCVRHSGPLLSGDKLVANQDFKESLLNQYPNAIGGEMEGAGLWSAAQRARKEWIIVKGVCDWADGKKHDKFHHMAAAAAVSLCRHVLSDEHALDGI